MKNIYLGIDVGGTHTRAVLLDGPAGTKPDCFVIDTPRNKKDFLKVLRKFIESAIESAGGGKKIAGLGAGLPGMIDPQKGVLIKAQNLPFLNGWEAEKFFKQFGAPVQIDNDCRCFLRAEAALGSARGYKNVIGVAIGTGIGGGIMLEGKIYSGAHNSAGEFGHMVIDGGKTFEQLAAKKAFLEKGDTSASIGIGVANLINAFDPEIVVLGGGGVTSGKIKIETVKNTAKKFIVSPLSRKTLIVKGRLGETAQAIGAALLFH